MKWWKRFRQRPDDDFLLNLFDTILWGVAFGVAGAILWVFA